MGVELDTDFAPVLVLRYQHPVVFEDFEWTFDSHIQYCKESEELGRGKHSLLVDLRGFNPLSGTRKMRQSVRSLMDMHQGYLQRFVVCEARISSNPVVRGILTAYDCLSVPPWPSKNVGSVAVAEHWLQGRLALAGVAMPANLHLPDDMMTQRSA